jgi:hypothetical protein
MRRLLVVCVVALLPLPALAADQPEVRLAAGESAFWSGPFIQQSSGDSWTYEIAVTERAYRLRIGFDHPDVEDNFQVRIIDPDGDTAASLGPGAGLYSAEFRKESAETGTWKVEVVATEVAESGFRLRAKLEAQEPSIGHGKAPVFPNLQVLPPHAASFLMPVTNGTTADRQIGVDVAGRHACHPEEVVEDQAVRCLRFAFGIRNTGLGPLELHDEGPPYQDHILYQTIHRADDSTYQREIGIARYHKTHAHYHHHDAVALQLYAVKDRKHGTLEPSGPKHFKGFAHRDELLRDWEHFYPTWTKSGFGLLAGWSDIYEWDRPGNYIDFGLNEDGYYMIRMWADPREGVFESNEQDNVGYTYFKVEGSEVTLLEAGRGLSPWDRCKIEVGFGGNVDPRGRPRPANCPPDTI